MDNDHQDHRKSTKVIQIFVTIHAKIIILINLIGLIDLNNIINDPIGNWNLIRIIRLIRSIRN
jgi:hypothetical protein